jgi:hypothetical protein
VLWEHEEDIARDKWITGTGGTRIPVLFYIPPGSPATDDADSNNEVVWRLAASAAVRGVDFAVRFKVPVYVTGETAPAPAPGAPLLEEYSAPALDAAALLACGVRRTADGRYVFLRRQPSVRDEGHHGGPLSGHIRPAGLVLGPRHTRSGVGHHALFLAYHRTFQRQRMVLAP